MISEEGLRKYMRLMPDDKEDLSLYLMAAYAKAQAAGLDNIPDNAQYDLFIYALATMFYENRGMAFSGSYQATAEETARAMINSFVLSSRYSHGEGDLM